MSLLTTIDDFQKMIDVNTPIIYINDYDIARVDDLILKAVGNKSEILEWNPAQNACNFFSKESIEIPLQQWLKDECGKSVRKENKKERVLVLREIQDFMDDPSIKMNLAMIAQRKLYDPNFHTTVLLVSSVIKVPVEIEKYVSYLDIGFPDDKEIEALISSHIAINKYDEDKFNDKDREALLPSLRGMTPFEIDRMLDMAMSDNGSLSSEDKEMIQRQKKQMVKQSGVLELVESKQTIDQIGGLEHLKKYLQDKKVIIKNLQAAENHGVSVPKGIFLVGMPGCGKSLCAKAAATLFEVPLLKLDMGSLMGKYVGESEERLRKAIKIADAAAPCVLWVDEIEKALSGVGGSGNNDILSRMFGYLLSWLQDKTSGVYVIATANDASNLPPELKRKGRFDEIFCVNMPNEEERQLIFKVHLSNKYKKNPRLFSNESEIEKISRALSDKQTEGFNGADIESVVNTAVENNYRLNHSKTKEGEMITPIFLDDVKDIAKNTISIRKSCKGQIEKMEKLFSESKFIDASTGAMV